MSPLHQKSTVGGEKLNKLRKPKKHLPQMISQIHYITSFKILLMTFIKTPKTGHISYILDSTINNDH
jgi:hypothetical protein